MKTYKIGFFLICLLFTTASCDQNGKKDDSGVTNKYPTKVVSLAPSITEIVYYIGEGHRLIADTRYCDYPAEAANLPKVGGMTDVDIEKIVKLKPDLILASYSGNNRETVENLQMLGFHVVTLYEKNVTDILTNIRIVGELFGKNTMSYVEECASKISSLPPRQKRTKVMVVLSIFPIFSVSPQSFIGDVIYRSGLENVVNSYTAYPQIEREAMYHLAPKLLLVSSELKKEELTIKQIKSQLGMKFDIVYIDANMMSRPGPRIFDLIRELAAIQ